MSKQEYLWMLGLAVAWRQRNIDDQGDHTPVEMASVTAVAGQLRQPELQAANELTAMVHLLVLISALNLCQILRYSREIHRNRAKYFQNTAAPVFSPALAVFLAVQRLHETGRQFLEPDTLCQMISPLTL